MVIMSTDNLVEKLSDAEVSKTLKIAMEQQEKLGLTVDPLQNQPCRVCDEPAAGFHFGAFTCEGCKSFFGRTCNNQSAIQDCKNNYECVVDKKNRTACKACRLRKCLMVGMSKSGSRYGRRSNWFKIHCLMQKGSFSGNSQTEGLMNLISQKTFPKKSSALVTKRSNSSKVPKFAPSPSSPPPTSSSSSSTSSPVKVRPLDSEPNLLLSGETKSEEPENRGQAYHHFLSPILNPFLVHSHFLSPFITDPSVFIENLARLGNHPAHLKTESNDNSPMDLTKPRLDSPSNYENEVLNLSAKKDR